MTFRSLKEVGHALSQKITFAIFWEEREAIGSGRAGKWLGLSGPAQSQYSCICQPNKTFVGAWACYSAREVWVVAQSLSTGWGASSAAWLDWRWWFWQRGLGLNGGPNKVALGSVAVSVACCCPTAGSLLFGVVMAAEAEADLWRRQQSQWSIRSCDICVWCQAQMALGWLGISHYGQLLRNSARNIWALLGGKLRFPIPRISGCVCVCFCL